MSFIESIKNRAKKDIKRIVLPESMDNRVIEAAKKIRDEHIADVIIIGNINDSSLDGIEIIDPNNIDLTNIFINEGTS